jgi:hypothetical protein
MYGVLADGEIPVRIFGASEPSGLSDHKKRFQNMRQLVQFFDDW